MYPVLIVEDEAAIADLIEDTLARLDYPCVKVFDGEEAATCIEEQTFDLNLSLTGTMPMSSGSMAGTWSASPPGMRKAASSRSCRTMPPRRSSTG